MSTFRGEDHPDETNVQGFIREVIRDGLLTRLIIESLLPFPGAVLVRDWWDTDKGRGVMREDLQVLGLSDPRDLLTRPYPVLVEGWVKRNPEKDRGDIPNPVRKLKAVSPAAVNARLARGSGPAPTPPAPTPPQPSPEPLTEGAPPPEPF